MYLKTPTRGFSTSKDRTTESSPHRVRRPAQARPHPGGKRARGHGVVRLSLASLLGLSLMGFFVPDSSHAKPRWESFGLEQYDVLSVHATPYRLFACAYDRSFETGRGLFMRELSEVEESGTSIHDLDVLRPVWMQCALPELGFSSVWSSPVRSFLVFATVLESRSRHDPKIYRSLDGGLTWERRDHGIPAGKVWKLSGDAETEPELLVTTEHGVYRSTDLGESWGWIYKCEDGATAKDVVVDPLTGARFFTQVSNAYAASVWTFQPGARPSTVWSAEASNVNLFRADARHGEVFASVGAAVGGLIVTEDGGRRWDSIPIIPGAEFYALALGNSRTPQPSERILVTAKLWGEEPVYVSHDGGRIWSPLNDGLPRGPLAVLSLEPDAAQDGVFYLGQGIRAGGVYRLVLDEDVALLGLDALAQR